MAIEKHTPDPYQAKTSIMPYLAEYLGYFYYFLVQYVFINGIMVIFCAFFL